VPEKNHPLQHSGIDTSNPFGGGQAGFGQGGTPGKMHGFIQPNQQQPTTGFGHSVQQSGGFGHGQPDRFAQQSSSNTGFGQQSSSNTGFGQVLNSICFHQMDFGFQLKKVNQISSTNLYHLFG
jgi:hypothetical protein